MGLPKTGVVIYGFFFFFFFFWGGGGGGGGINSLFHTKGVVHMHKKFYCCVHYVTQLLLLECLKAMSYVVPSAQISSISFR